MTGPARLYALRMSTPTVITRFAPSPTGDLHIGGARTALFCWALARAKGGRFLIRLEDTDRARSSDASARAILEDLAWLGLSWDDGPVHAGNGGDERAVGPFEQSNRLDLYTEHLKRLIETGRAYPAFDTSEELAARRDAAQREKKTFVYRRADDYDHTDALKRMEAGEPCVIRFAADPTEEVSVRDEVLGEVKFAPGELEDFVIRKADGFPTYHFAVVVDDALMGVTHVLRGQEHLSNTPKHVALQRALGFETPVYAHMPLIFNDKGAKMSKRERDQVARDAVKQRGLDDLPVGAGDRAVLERWVGDKKSQLDAADLERLADAVGIDLPEVSVKDFRAAGYLPGAIVNFIALLGWTPPKNEDGSERERFDAAFLAEHFSLEKIGKSNARFDRKKLLSFNMDAILAMEPASFVDAFRTWAAHHAPEVAAVPEALITAVQPQSKTLRDTAQRCAFAVERPDDYDDKAVKKFLAKNDGEGLRLLGILRERFASLDAWEAEALETLVGSVAEREGVGMGQVAQPVRIALTGAGVSPAIGATLAVLGRDETLARIDRCVEAHASLA
ncbi:MAG: glutamate--tRNA ligase [Phycisphaerales bacterium]